MHILLVHQAFATIEEPGGTRHHEMARYLAAKGHRVTVIASAVSYLTGETDQQHSPWTGRGDEDEGVSIIRASTYGRLHRSFVWRVFNFLSFMVSAFIIGLRVKKVDVVWGTTPPLFQGLTAWALARLKGAAFLFEVRDLWPAFAVAVGVLRSKPLIWASERLERFLYSHADRLIVNSPGFSEHVEARGGKEVTLVPNGAEASMFDPEATGADFRREQGLGNKFVALYAGAHGLSNDLGVVLQAAVQLREDADIAIVLLGDGKEKDVLRAQAAEMKLTNLHFVPPLPKQAMAEALAAADTCIAILKPIEMYKTVYPNKVFDYMAAGRPVILAIDGVVREVVEQAGAGLFAKPGDPTALAQAVRTLAAAPEKARAMGLAGRAYLEEHFDRPILAEKLARLLQQMQATDVNHQQPD